MKQILKIVEKISELQYIGEDSTKKSYRVESTVPVRKGQTILAKNGRITGVIRAETFVTYNV